MVARRLDRAAGLSAPLNLYRPPALEPGNAADADPWLDHVHKVYPGNADHIVRWLAHRVQRPGEKVNHALVLGGVEGIGKDTLLEPMKYAVGPWNFYEISPHNLLGRFNGLPEASVLRVSEARDAGELDRFALLRSPEGLHRGAAGRAARRREAPARILHSRTVLRPGHHHQLPHRRALPAADRPPALRRLVVARQGGFRGGLLDHAVGLVLPEAATAMLRPTWPSSTSPSSTPKPRRPRPRRSGTSSTPAASPRTPSSPTCSTSWSAPGR